ncbi:MAG: pectin esterase, partial [Spongiibacteraceae bacterium]|nr:pectin esterase [Spongiibacteraceae bacterium]
MKHRIGFQPLFLLAFWGFNLPTLADTLREHALVDPLQSQSGSYTSIVSALKAAPDNATSPWVIRLKAGHYAEKIIVNKPNIHIIGEGKNNTVISYNAYAGQHLIGSSDTWGTRRSATVTVQAKGFHAQNLTIENNFDWPGNDALEKNSPHKIKQTQAVALMLGHGNDQALFNNVSLKGYQDTLFINSGRSLFYRSSISGNIDFIFGAGQALFVQSDIITRARADKRKTAGIITAPSTDITNGLGFVFYQCKLLKEPGVPANSTWLGRPWHPTTVFKDGRYADPNAIGASMFIDTYMDNHIAESGWTSMNGTQRNGKKTLAFKPENSRFYEHNNHGPG